MELQKDLRESEKLSGIPTKEFTPKESQKEIRERVESSIIEQGAKELSDMMGIRMKEVAREALMQEKKIGLSGLASDRFQPGSVAVLYFKNETGDTQYDPLQKGIAEFLIADLLKVHVETIRRAVRSGELRAASPGVGHGKGADLRVSRVELARDLKRPRKQREEASKRNRQNQKRRAHHRHYRSRMRTQIKTLRAAIESGDAAAAQEQLKSTVSIIQRVTQKGIIHRRQAARRVSRLARAVSAMSAD